MIGKNLRLELTQNKNFNENYEISNSANINQCITPCITCRQAGSVFIC